MVSQPYRPYERRRQRPVVMLVAALAALALITWTIVLATTGGGAQTSCPSPPGGEGPGEVLDAGALDDQTPAPADTVRVRVLNAGGQRGQANLVAAQLGDLRFAEAAPPQNDPLFPDGDMSCIGQLRFGKTGSGAAATLTLVLPCAELVLDGRPDDNVDVAVGTEFRDVAPSRTVRNLLDELAHPSADASTPDPNAVVAPPTVGPEARAMARDTC